MAFVSQNQNDEEQNKMTGTTAPPPSPSNTAGAPQESKKPTGSGFVNVNKYLQANQPSQFGQQTAQKVTGLGDKAKTEVAGQQQQFGSALAQSKQNLEGSKNLGTTLLGNVEAIGYGNSPSSAEDLSKFQSFIGGTYQGPEGFEDPSKALARSRVAQSVGNLAGAQGGQGKQQLLQTFYARPSYSQGQQGLDTLFLTQGGAQQALQGAAKGTRGLEASTQQQLGIAAQQGGMQKQADLSERAGERGQIQSQYAANQADIQNSIRNNIAAEQRVNQERTQRLASGGRLSAQEAADMGITLNDTANYGGLNLGDAWNTVDAGSVNMGQAANQSQTAKMLGLSKLAGNIVPNIDASQYSFDKAGTAKYSGVNQNVLRNLMGQIAARQTADADAASQAKGAADLANQVAEGMPNISDAADYANMIPHGIKQVGHDISSGLSDAWSNGSPFTKHY